MNAAREPRIYLDGNSLGPPAPDMAARLSAFVEEQWRASLIGGWDDHGWWDLPVRLGDRIAPLIGAAPGQVVVGESTTVMWFKAVSAALRMRPDARRLVTELGNFPTDRHVIDAVAAAHGVEVVAVPGDELVRALDPDTAVLALTHVDYRTGARHDLAALTGVAHDHGALALWDLSHSTGAMQIDLDDAGADLAVGCTYKYLDGGPGSPAFVYVAARHLDRLEQPIPGWVGHADPFSMDETHRPADGIRRMLSGTPSVLSMQALDVALDAFDGVDMGELRARSVALTERFIELADRHLVPLGFEVVTPRDPERRGGQVSLRHARAREVIAAAVEVGVVGDFRVPDLCRFGLPPMHLTLDEVEQAVHRLARLARSTF